MHGHFHRAFGAAELRREFRVGRVAAAAGERELEVIELTGLAVRDELLAQPRQRAVEQRERPAALVKFVGGGVVHRLERVAVLRGDGVEREEVVRAAAAFLRLRFVPFVREKMLHRREQERAEAALRAVHAREPVLREQAREKFLREILRVVRRMPLPPHERVERIPIRLAQARKRVARARGIAAALRVQHETPVRLGELRARAGSRAWRRVRCVGGGVVHGVRALTTAGAICERNFVRGSEPRVLGVGKLVGSVFPLVFTRHCVF